MSNFKTGSQPISSSLNGGYPQASTYLDYIQNRKGKRPEDERQLFDTADEKMKRIHDIIWQISGTNVPILITGETGAGKQTIARAIHEASHGTEKPYIIVNCGSLATSVLDRELFGFENSVQEYQAGKFEIAANGTLVLNNITEMDLSLQGKLLKVLQDNVINPANNKAPIPIHTRIIATTHRDILKAVAQGKFRQDLYYRLYVLHIEVPPLRERPKDIALLAKKFVDNYAKNFNRPLLQLSENAYLKLKSHSWPENIKELEEIVQKSILLSNSDIIGPESIPIDGETPVCNLEWVSTLPIGQTLHLVETHFILKTLAFHNGNRTHAAKTLGISLRTLRNKINEFIASGHEVPAPQLGRTLP